MLLQSLIIIYQEKDLIPYLVSLIFSGYGQDEKKYVGILMVEGWRRLPLQMMQVEKKLRQRCNLSFESSLIIIYFFEVVLLWLFQFWWFTCVFLFIWITTIVSYGIEILYNSPCETIYYFKLEMYSIHDFRVNYLSRYCIWIILMLIHHI